MKKDIVNIISEINNNIIDGEVNVVDYSHTFKQQTKEELLEDGIVDIESHVLFDIQIKANTAIDCIEQKDINKIMQFISKLDSMKNVHVELFYDYKKPFCDSLIINFRTRNENKEFNYSVAYTYGL
jgi:hypothetical protein